METQSELEIEPQSSTTDGDPVEEEKKYPGPHARIKGLACYDEIFALLSQGFPLQEVARFIREDRHESTEITLSGLISALFDFKHDMIKVGAMDDKQIPQAIMKAVRKIRGGTDAIEEMNELYKVQRGRIETDLAVEARHKKLLKGMPVEMDLAMRMIRQIVDVQQELGMTPKNLGRLELSQEIEAKIASIGKSEVRAVLEDPQRRRKIAGIIEKLSALDSDRRQRIVEALADRKSPPEEVYGPTPGINGNVVEHPGS